MDRPDDDEHPEIVHEDDGRIDYTPFYKAVKEGDRNNIETFIESHPQALTTNVYYEDIPGMGTALHYVLRKLDDLEEGKEIAKFLVDRMTPDDLETKDYYRDTPLATAIKSHLLCPVDDVLKLMVNKNPNLANIMGYNKKVPVYLASEKKLKDTTSYLYDVTDRTILLKMEDKTRISFLSNLVHMNLFGIASDILQDLPNIRRDHTILALARRCLENDDIDYSPFYKAIKEGDRNNIETFIESHPQARSIGVPYDDDDDNHGNEGTALHYVLRKLDKLKEGEEITKFLVDRMTSDHLEIIDNEGDTPLVTAIKSGSCPLDVLKLMVEKNPNLANNKRKVPVYLASESMLEDTTHYLFYVTDKSILLSMEADTMRSFLKNLVHMNLFGIASDVVQALPYNLRDCRYHTISALACKFSGPGHHDIKSEALAFLQSVFSVPSSSYEWFVHETCGIIVEDAQEFFKELFRIRPDILQNYQCREIILEHAVRQRQKYIFDIVCRYIQQHGLSESVWKQNDKLYMAAELAPSYVLNRKSGAVLQMQSEIQWFQVVRKMTSPKCRESRNSDEMTPHELFMERHKSLKEAGEKSMKEIAQSCTVVGALIVTIMFAAAFTVPGGNDQNTGLPVFLKTVMFKVFIICDAISLYSSATSVLACLGILMSRYAEEDFVVKLPRRLMVSLSTLFFSVTTMMAAFCAALTIMLDGNLQLILPVVLLALAPIVIFLVYTVSLLYEIYMSTYRFGVTEKKAKLLQKAKDEKARIKPSSIDTKLSNKKGGESMV